VKTWAKVRSKVYFRLHFSGGEFAMAGWSKVDKVNKIGVYAHIFNYFFRKHSERDIILPDTPLTRLMFP
jgi:hypothetical protein